VQNRRESVNDGELCLAHCEWDQPLTTGGVFRCVRCTQKTLYLGVTDSVVKRVCNSEAARGQVTKAVEIYAEQLGQAVGLDVPGSARAAGYLLGDFVADLAKAVGVPPCNSCTKRQEWLNSAHAWIIKKLSR
jgi:hypothetical protein